jgi:tripartite ATP-independent transporter DctP family solute receptor
MKKISLVLIITLVLAFIVVQPAMAVQVIKCGHGHSITHPVHLGFEMFKSLIELKTDDYVVELFPSSQLGSEAEMAEMAKLGTLQAVMFGRFESMGKQLYTPALPFVFKDYDHVNRVLNGPVGDYLASFTEDNGLKLLGWAHSGFRQLTNNVRPIKSPADLKGLKMRTPPLENILKTIDAFGTSAVSIAYNELYMALKTGVVDGQENPYVNIVSEKFYEVQKYCTEVNYIYMPGPFCVGLVWWESLSAEDQKIIAEAAKVATMYTNYITESTEKAYKQECINQGMEIYEPTEEERQAFIKMVQPVYDFFIEDGASNQMLIELIQNS